MTIAFVVHIEVDTASVPDLVGIGEDIEDALVGVGFDVRMVNPWERPSLSVTDPNAALTPQGIQTN